MRWVGYYNRDTGAEGYKQRADILQVGGLLPPCRSRERRCRSWAQVLVVGEMAAGGTAWWGPTSADAASIGQSSRAKTPGQLRTCDCMGLHQPPIIGEWPWAATLRVPSYGAAGAEPLSGSMHV